MVLSAAEIDSLQGAESARVIVIALFGLSVYEWLITIDDEIRYFWTGPWNASRALFLLNRYLAPAIGLLGLLSFSIRDPSPQVCKLGISALFVAGILALTLVQAMLVIRVWYLFGNRTTRFLVLATFFLTTGLALLLAINAGVELRVTPSLAKFGIPGCRASRPERFWRVYLPGLFLHTLLYFLTAFRALKNRRLLKEAPILKRLVRDGGFFYLVVFLSVLLTATGSFLTQYPTLNILAIFSNFPVITSSLAASRVMLSIHSLAAKLGSDSAWLLNNVELSRVPWRRGATEGEIIVEVGGGGYDDEKSQWSDDEDLERGSVRTKTSRVGRWTDETW